MEEVLDTVLGCYEPEAPISDKFLDGSERHDQQGNTALVVPRTHLVQHHHFRRHGRGNVKLPT